MQLTEELLPWSFLDHYHYARWLSVHLRDIKELTKAPLCPEIAQAFAAGKLSPEDTQRVLICCSRPST